MAPSSPGATDLTPAYAKTLREAGITAGSLWTHPPGRTLVLEGTVASYGAKNRAAECISATTGRPINNRLVVAPGRDDNEALAERVRSAIKTFALPGNEILVIAEDEGRVTLAGRARSSRAALSASAVAQCVDGVSEVRSRIITASREETDAGIAAAVSDQVAHLLMVDTVEVSVSDGAVTLDGTILNVDLRNRAEAIARWHPAVTDVNNRLTVTAEDAKSPVG
jgi:osmotically-inducible protein OsmY